MKVFISHGHDEIAKLKIKDYIGTQLTHEPIILGEQPDRHQLTVIEALERFSAGCEFAVVLLTGDDRTEAGQRRARQNVVHEIGYLQGRLGRSRVILLVQKGTEIPSNLAGLFYLGYSSDIKETFTDLERALDAKDASAFAKSVESPGLSSVVAEAFSAAGKSHADSIAERLCKDVERIVGMSTSTHKAKRLRDYFRQKLKEARGRLADCKNQVEKAQTTSGEGIGPALAAAFGTLAFGTMASDMEKECLVLEKLLEAINEFNETSPGEDVVRELRDVVHLYLPPPELSNGSE